MLALACEPVGRRGSCAAGVRPRGAWCSWQWRCVRLLNSVGPGQPRRTSKQPHSHNKQLALLRRYVDLFAEEVVRGGPAFALSLVLSAVEPALRAAAELGAWQLISPVNALGRVAVVEGLHEVQDEVRCLPLMYLCRGACILPTQGVDSLTLQLASCIFLLHTFADVLLNAKSARAEFTRALHPQNDTVLPSA